MARVKASAVDKFFAIIDEPQRSCDFTVFVVLDRRGLTIDSLKEKLESGYRIALQIYPKAASTFCNGYWQTKDKLMSEIAIEYSNLIDPYQSLAQTYSKPIDLSQTPQRQILYVDKENDIALLFFQFHHALGDFASALLFLQAQLASAFSADDKMPSTATAALDFRIASESSSDTRVDKPKRSRYTTARFGDFNARNAEKSAYNICLDRDRIIQYIDSLDFEVSYSNLLQSWCYLALTRVLPVDAVANQMVMTVPVDIRRVPFYGFGNGSGLIKLAIENRADYKLSEVVALRKRKLRELLDRGDWQVKVPWLLEIMPYSCLRFLIRGANHLNIGDHGTTIFSNLLQSTDAPLEDPRLRLKSLNGIAPLNYNYPFTLNTISLGRYTNLTITYNNSIEGTKIATEYYDQLREIILADIPDVMTQIE